RRYRHTTLVDAPPGEPFFSLMRAITSQQLSTKASATIFRRVLDLMGGAASPVALATLADEQLRQAGLSRQKTAYLRDLSAKVLSGELPLDALPDMSDDEVIAAITKVKGLGRWSAEMFLMFRLRRPDVLPVDDLGIVNAIHRAYRLRKKPKPDRIRRIGEVWRPYRTVACWYLWRSLENTPMAKDENESRKKER
ncbi:MAG: hypothetical protein DMF85_14265, partial [Acidobacteria bacterium]